MDLRIGLWIDHARAILVRFDGAEQPTLKTISSGVERRHKSYGFEGRPGVGQIHASPEHKQDHRRHNVLSRFYRQILKSISPADEVLIIGPGLAKQELRRLIDDDPRMKKRLGAVQNAERMTQNQLIARVRQFFTLRSQAKRRPVLVAATRR